MKAKFYIPFVAATVLTGCKVDSDNCPRSIEVPFVSVEIPDSARVRSEFTIDMQIHDLGCYQSARVLANALHDTIYLSDVANYDECGCPAVSNDLEISRIASLDTISGGKTKYFVYVQINSTKDSVHFCRDSVVLY